MTAFFARLSSFEIEAQRGVLVEKPIVLIGAGGHGRVVYEALLAAGPVTVYSFDDRYGGEDGEAALKESGVPSWIPAGPVREVPTFLRDHPDAEVVVAIGNNATRRHIVRWLEGELATARSEDEVKVRFARAIHPSAVISSTARLGEGVMILPGAIVTAGAQIGPHTILNTAASVDHDCSIGAFSHIAPGARLGGGVVVEEGVHVGIGASVIPERHIGAWSVVGAGAAVVRDIPPGVVAYGVPAVPHRLVERPGE